jgi:SAM-dependent methyltransferase
MGTTGKRPLQVSSNPKIQARFHPYSQPGAKHAYPLNRVMHEFAKLPRETVANFVDVNAVTSELKESPEIKKLLSRHPELEASFKKSLWNAIRERGVKGTKFWAKAPKEYIDQIVAAAGKNPNPMNNRLGEVARDYFGSAVKPRIILDIGTFAGGTVTAVVKNLSPAQRAQLKVVLVDVNGKVVKGHAVPALVALGVPRQNILVLPTSFYSAAVAFGQMRRPLHEKGERRFAKQFKSLIGKVDFISAGAATLNFANDLGPLLRSAKRLLKPGGVFADWEWGSAEVRSPTVNTRQLKSTVIGTIEGRPITEYDAYTSFLNFWMGVFKYPEHVKQKLFSDIEASQNFNFFNWCERNVEWMEREREQSGAQIPSDPIGFRNRAYRDGNAMVSAARKLGLRAENPFYPIGKPGVLDTGNVNWLAVMQK